MSQDATQPQQQPCSGNRLPYLQWHAMAERLNRKGIRQKLCVICGLWVFPQEQCTQFDAASRRHLAMLKREGAA